MSAVVTVSRAVLATARVRDLPRWSLLLGRTPSLPRVPALVSFLVVRSLHLGRPGLCQRTPGSTLFLAPLVLPHSQLLGDVTRVAAQLQSRLEPLPL